MTSPNALDLGAHGIATSGAVFANLSTAVLAEQILARSEGLLTNTGAIVAYTGKRTGRSPQDRFLVESGPSKDIINWGKVNRPLAPAVFGQAAKKKTTPASPASAGTLDRIKENGKIRIGHRADGCYGRRMDFTVLIFALRLHDRTDDRHRTTRRQLDDVVCVIGRSE
jgi:hypothetical protein